MKFMKTCAVVATCCHALATPTATDLAYPLYHVSGGSQFRGNCLTAFGQDEVDGQPPYSFVGMAACGAANQVWTHNTTTGHLCTDKGRCIAGFLTGGLKEIPFIAMMWNDDFTHEGDSGPLSFDFTQTAPGTGVQEHQGALSLRGDCSAMLFDSSSVDSPVTVGHYTEGFADNCTANPGFASHDRNTFVFEVVQ
jgi:hypothetical protein